MGEFIFLPYLKLKMQFQKQVKGMEKGTNETFDKSLKHIADDARWVLAHKSEKNYWQDYTTESLRKESGDRYEKKAKFLIQKWGKFIKISKNLKILQVGCGPEDVINYLPVKQKYSIDPLADFYKKQFGIDYKSTHLKKARGEEIPFQDKFFDIVILINVLDHTQLPDKVLNELKRVLKDNGIFYFENYFYQKEFIQIAKIFGKMKKIISGEIFNIHHPYMFTLNDLKMLLSQKFSIQEEEIGTDIGIYENLSDLEKNPGRYENLHHPNKKTSRRKLSRKILDKFGLIGIINYSCICRKK